MNHLNGIFEADICFLCLRLRNPSRRSALWIYLNHLVPKQEQSVLHIPNLRVIREGPGPQSWDITLDDSEDSTEAAALIEDIDTSDPSFSQRRKVHISEVLEFIDLDRRQLRRDQAVTCSA